MRNLFVVVLALLLQFSLNCAYGASASAPAASSNPSPVALTPEQARSALQVLNDPKSRAQIEVTLRAIAAAGALSAPPAASGAGAAGAASGASGASAASSVLGAIATSNGLASQLSRQLLKSLREVGNAVRMSAAALLDVRSVTGWWRYEIMSPAGRAQLRTLGLALAAVLIPAFVVSVLVGLALKRHVARLEAAPGPLEGDVAGAPPGGGADGTQVGDPAANSNANANANATAGLHLHGADRDAERAARSQRNAAYAGAHWSLLQRLPRALIHVLLRCVPLAAFLAVAYPLTSLLTDDGSPEERILGALIEIYAIARAVALAGDFFFAPTAPRLRLFPLGDAWAAFAGRWIERLVVVLGVGAALASVPLPLGLTSDAHLGLVKAVTLVGHVMVALLILQVRRPVRDWIRARCTRTRAFKFVGGWLADAWAPLAVFFVMALWFVWALDVRNGYRVLLHDGGWSIVILIVARIVAIVTFGLLGRLFRTTDGENGSIALKRAHRYYPLLRRAVSIAIVVVAAGFILGVWGFDVWHTLKVNYVGRRLTSACVTIAIAGLVAIFVWEVINVAIERRLGKWTASGDLMRAARLRTLLPMFKTMLFIGIALVVGLTGLSELGVNIGPLLAGASIFGVALGFGSQKLVQDFITGMFLLMENAMQVGDWVTVAGVSGTVEYLSIRTVRLRGGDGSLYTVPFSSVSTVNNSNRGLGNASVKINIAYDQDVERAVQALTEIGASLREDPKYKDGIVGDFSFWGVDSVDGASVTLVGQMQCRDTSRWPVQREFNRRILEEFRARGIAVANPLRNVLVPGPGMPNAANTPADTPAAEGKPAS